MLRSTAVLLSTLLVFASCGEQAASTSDTKTTSASVASTSGPRGTKTELSDKKVEITYFKKKAEMEVRSVTMDFYPTTGEVLRDPKKDGKQFVRVDLTFKNTGTDTFKVNYTQAHLDGTTTKDETQTSLINKTNATDILGVTELAVGETVSGALYFEVTESEKKEDLSISYKGYDGESKEYAVALK